MKKYIKIDVTYIMFILNIFTMYCNFNYFSNYRIIRDGLMLIIGAFLIVQIPKYKVFRDEKILWLLLLFLSVIIIGSAYLHKHEYRTYNILLMAIEWVVTIFENFILMRIAAARGILNSVVDSYIKVLAIIAVINDILAVTVNAGSAWYLLGSKFTVIYLHLFIFSLYLYNSKRLNEDIYKEIVTFSLFTIYMIWLSVSISCATGIVGTIIYLLFYWVFRRYKYIFMRPSVFFAILLICGSFFITYAIIINSEMVQKFIVEVLGRNLTLTGRVEIYEKIPFILRNHVLFGYGYGTSNYVYVYFTGYANSQNGLLEWVSQIGVSGTAVLVALIIYCLPKNVRSANYVYDPYLLMTYLYVLVLISTVEVSINRLFIATITLLWAASKEKEIE